MIYLVRVITRILFDILTLIWYSKNMTTQQVKDIMIRSIARSMEAEGADYDRVLARMQSRMKSTQQKKQKG